jgi:hypothetical protein
MREREREREKTLESIDFGNFRFSFSEKTCVSNRFKWFERRTKQGGTS